MLPEPGECPHPTASLGVVKQCDALGINQVWFHRSIDAGRVSGEAVAECHARGIQCIVGGCPMMFCEPVDVGHECMRRWYQWKGSELK